MRRAPLHHELPEDDAPDSALTEPQFRGNVVVMKAEAVATSARRGYRMQARADAAEQTALRIMDAAAEPEGVTAACGPSVEQTSH